jgi:DNA-binding transcriptional MerR regulator
MNVNNEKMYDLEETAILLHVSKSTLRIWDRTKYFVAGRTRGKHRRYTGKQIIELKKKMFSSEIEK